MIYLFTGEDAKKKLESYEKFLKSAPRGAEVFIISRNEFDKVQIGSFYSGAGLFSPLSIVVFQNILEREETRDFIMEKLDLIGESPNYFIFLEGKLNKPVIDAFKKSKAHVEVFELAREKKEKFNNFLLATAFEKKEKLYLWIYFRQALESGAGMDELTGILFWKVKDMILKRDFSRFSEDELKNFSSRLSYLLPQARRIGDETEFALEQFLLEAF